MTDDESGVGLALSLEEAVAKEHDIDKKDIKLVIEGRETEDEPVTVKARWNDGE